MGALGVFVGVPILALMLGAGLLVIGMRVKSRVVLDSVRRFNKGVANPAALKMAGSPQSRTSVIRHFGRRSGRKYQTPVDIVPTATGFVIALPYGTRADWVRNVLAAGSATVLTDGRQVDVHEPAVTATSEVAHLLPPGQLRTLRIFGVNECLLLQRTTPPL